MLATFLGLIYFAISVEIRRNLYSFDGLANFSTEIHCFSSKFDGLLQKIPIATICFNHLFQFHSLKQISQ